MTLTDLLHALAQPAAYPFAVGEVEVHQTHISAVFLAGDFAYKLKKPVNLGFVDFSTLEKRRHFCEEEVRLNRRLAPSVYLGVVPIVATPAGLRIEGEGQLVDWAVKMRRLPAEATLENRLRAGQLDVVRIEELARRVARFHASAETNGRTADSGRFAVVAQNARDNFTQSTAQVGTTVSAAVFERLRRLTDEWLERLASLIEERASRGVPRDTHGDMHLDHVYLFPNQLPPDDLVIIDCIEFNDRFRFADPVADMAFLVMDLRFHGRADLARAFAEEYFRSSGDEEGRRLLRFYTAYRALVRAKVEGMESLESEVPAEERAEALNRSRAHWLLALGDLEEQSARPALVLVGGLPGSGKSTLARGLAEHAGFVVIRSDVVRKELAGVAADQATPEDQRARIYSDDFTHRTYEECLRRAEEQLWQGRRVLIDANFRREGQRRLFLDLAERWAVPASFFVCAAAPELIRARLAARHGDVSDADWSVHVRLASEWEQPGPATSVHSQRLAAAATPEEMVAAAVERLRQHELV